MSSTNFTSDLSLEKLLADEKQTRLNSDFVGNLKAIQLIFNLMFASATKEQIFEMATSLIKKRGAVKDVMDSKYFLEFKTHIQHIFRQGK